MTALRLRLFPKPGLQLQLQGNAPPSPGNRCSAILRGKLQLTGERPMRDPESAVLMGIETLQSVWVKHG